MFILSDKNIIDEEERKISMGESLIFIVSMILTLIYIYGKTSMDIDDSECPVLSDTYRVGMIFCLCFRGSITNY